MSLGGQTEYSERIKFRTDSMKSPIKMTALIAALATLSLTVPLLTLEAQAQTRSGAIRTQNGGIRGASYQGANGSYRGASGAVNGVGAFRKNNYSANTAKGNVAGSTSNVYNAQTGQGTRIRNRSIDTNKDGTVDKSATTTTNYSKGSGATTTVETQNNGTYSCSTGNGCSK
jgi:hypothetical protein